MNTVSNRIFEQFNIWNATTSTVIKGWSCCYASTQFKLLFNGTCLLIHFLHNNSINANVFTGSCADQNVLIPRIVLSPSSTELPFTLSRRQYSYPLRLAYAMTINKAQGQTFNRVGIYLECSCFSHGQHFQGQQNFKI